MSALVVYCHPSEGSFTAAVRDLVLAELSRAGVETEVIDLYAEGFDPVLSAGEWTGYLRSPGNIAPVTGHVAKVRAADTLIFVYPTWWYAQPALLKGWLDRVLLPDVAFFMPRAEGEGIKPALTHVKRLGVFTTCGASWWVTRFVGFPGRRILTRGVRILCAPRVRVSFAAHYLMDSSTPQSRARHLDTVRRRMRRLLR